jgi:hypothetical protein
MAKLSAATPDTELVRPHSRPSPRAVLCLIAVDGGGDFLCPYQGCVSWALSVKPVSLGIQDCRQDPDDFDDDDELVQRETFMVPHFFARCTLCHFINLLNNTFLLQIKLISNYN